jgi:hypothetical protein
MGQTGRTMFTRQKERVQEIEYYNSNSEYSSHVLNTEHAYGTTIDTMGVIRTHKKGKHLNTLEK